MRAKKVIAIAFLAPIAVLHAQANAPTDECVTVHLQAADLVPPDVLQVSKTTAARMFKEIRVSVDWRQSAAPREGVCKSVTLRFESDSPAALYPGAFGYALPNQDGGIQIHVFVDRILRCPSMVQNGVLLGHVLAHEIGHVLERISRHSEEGVMKPHWTTADINEMFARPLRFTALDGTLIHLGIAKKPRLSSVHLP
jgi:hypothetical protein